MKYICIGRVHPERAGVSFSRVEMKVEGGGSAVASCDASQVTVVLEVPSLDGWISACIMAEDVANIFVGALGFSKGCGYSVELIQVNEADGTPHVFGVQPRGETPEETLQSLHPGFQPSISIVRQRCLFPLSHSRLPASNYSAH